MTSDESSSRLWKGSFGSTDYGQLQRCTMRGKLEVLLPHPLGVNDKIDVAFIYEGIYKRDARKIVHLTLNKSTSETTDLKFGGDLDGQPISLEFKEIGNDKISGTYETSGPVDGGTLAIQITDDTTLDLTEQDPSPSQCIIL